MKQAWQVKWSVAPIVSEYLPTKHVWQLSVPALLLYLPGTHSTHSPPLGPVVPALQRQSVTAVDAAAERESAGHAVHAWLPASTL